MSENGHIFLSYRSIEADFALRLAADLKNIGAKLWMDRLDVGIKVGDDWVQALQDAINGCSAVIAVLSPEYIHSKYCRRELKRADTLGRTIYPVLLQNIAKEDWPFEIQEKEYIDLREWHDDSTYRREFDKLVQVLRQQRPAQFGDPPDREMQYLTGLIAELEAHRGVLEYVDLSGEAETRENVRPNPNQNMGWAQEFGLLVDFRLSDMPAELNNIKQIPLRNIQEAVEQYPRFVLIGEPGAGKTTVIRKLALDAARERLDNPHTAPLPVLLSLPTWNDESMPNDYIRAHWPFESDPMSLLAQGEVLLYLDGLNEMGATALAKAKHLREWLQSRDAPKRVIITCRQADYTTDLGFDLPAVLANKMDEARITRFAINYLGEERARPFLSRILSVNVSEQEDARHLSHLARNPYLLAALIYIYQNSPDGDLPCNSGQLFRGLARALWSREQRNRTSGWVPFEEMEAAFARLAFAMIDEDMPIDVSQDYALKHISDLTLLRAGQSANLVLIRDQYVRFYHQLIQEYFAAMALFHGSSDNRELMKVEKWRYVFAAWSGFVSDPELLLRELTFKEALSLTRAGYYVPKEIGDLLSSLQYGSDLGSPDWRDLVCIEKVVKNAGKLATPYLLRALQFDDARERGHAAYLLGFTVDPTAVPALAALLSDTSDLDLVGGVNYNCDAAAIALERIGTPEALTTVEQWRRDLFVSKSKIGGVLVAQGDGPGALSAYQEGLAIAEALAKRDPANTAWQRDLLISHERIGDVLMAQGDCPGALIAYQVCLEIRETLAKRDPANTQCQRDLSFSHNKIGDVLVAQGDGPGGLRAYQEGLAIAEALAKRDPANTQWQRDLSVSLEKIGNVLVAQGDGPGALVAYQAGLAISEALAKRDPANTEWQRDLSVSHNKIGNVLVAQGDGTGALSAYQEGLAIAEALAKRDPANTAWQVDTAVSCWKMGSLDSLLSINDRREYLQRGRQILSKLKDAGRLQANQDSIGKFDQALDDLQ